MIYLLLIFDSIFVLASFRHELDWNICFIGLKTVSPLFPYILQLFIISSQNYSDTYCNYLSMVLKTILSLVLKLNYSIIGPLKLSNTYCNYSSLVLKTTSIHTTIIHCWSSKLFQYILQLFIIGP